MGADTAVRGWVRRYCVHGLVTKQTRDYIESSVVGCYIRNVCAYAHGNQCGNGGLHLHSSNGMMHSALQN